MRLRRARPADVADLAPFEREYGGVDRSVEACREQFEACPDLFVVCRDGGRLVGAATGRPRRPEENPRDDPERAVVLDSVVVRPDRQGEGLGRDLLAAFEARAADRAAAVTAAAASNVEGFYRACGYEPSLVLVQVAESALPEDYERVPGAVDWPVRLVGQRSVGDDTRFLYLSFERYDPALRADLAAAFDAFEANTVYRKALSG